MRIRLEIKLTNYAYLWLKLQPYVFCFLANTNLLWTRTGKQVRCRCVFFFERWIIGYRLFTCSGWKATRQMVLTLLSADFKFVISVVPIYLDLSLRRDTPLHSFSNRGESQCSSCRLSLSSSISVGPLQFIVCNFNLFSVKFEVIICDHVGPKWCRKAKANLGSRYCSGGERGQRQEVLQSSFALHSSQRS